MQKHVSIHASIFMNIVRTYTLNIKVILMVSELPLLSILQFLAIPALS